MSAHEKPKAPKSEPQPKPAEKPAQAPAESQPAPKEILKKFHKFQKGN